MKTNQTKSRKQHQTRCRFIATLLISLSGLERNVAARNVDPPDYQLPVQNYAVIDLSGSVPGGDAVTQVALDDNGQVAFCLSVGSGGNRAYRIYKWVNGILTPPAPDIAEYRHDSVLGWQQWEISALAADGTYVGGTSFDRDLTSPSPLLDDDGSLAGGGSSDGFINETKYGAPPPFYTTSDIGGLEQGARLSPNGVYAAFYFDFYAFKTDGDYFSFSPGSRSMTVIVGGNTPSSFYGGDLPGGMSTLSGVNRHDFYISAVNNQGSAAGSTPAGAAFWNGTDLTSFGVAGDRGTGLNDQNQVVASENYPGEGYLWENSTSKPLLDVFATLVQGQYHDIQPFSISNPGAPSSSSFDPPLGPADTVIHILCLARNNAQPLSNLGSPLDRIVFRRSSGGQWNYAKMRLPDNISSTGLGAINKNGLIAAIGDPTGDTATDHALLLLPVELKDLKGAGDTDDVFVQFMADDNDNSPANIAWIEPTRSAGDLRPRMPQLRVSLKGGPSGLLVKWWMEIRYPRRSGRDDFNLPNPAYVQYPYRILAADQPWNIYDEFLNPEFYGGTCTIHMVIIDGSGNPLGAEQKFKFRIRGKNPEDSDCKNHIIASQGAVWYAWAVAKHESGDSIGIYNQFANGLANGGAGAHGAKGEPFYSQAEGDGWGLFQRDSASGHPVTTVETWSWDGNMKGFLTDEYPEALQIANSYVDGVKQNHSTTFEEPQFTIEGRSISGRDVIALTWYNGPQGRSNSSMLHFDGTKSSGQRWSLNLPDAPTKDGIDQPYVNWIMEAYNGG